MLPRFAALTMPVLAACALTLSSGICRGGEVDLSPVPGSVKWSWLANTFECSTMGGNGSGRWVQNYADEIEVTPDGTVVVGCVWDEGGRCLGLYKDGDVNRECLGKNNRGGGHKGGGWGTTTKAIVVTPDRIICASLDGELYRFSWVAGDIQSAKFLDATPIGSDREVVGMAVRDGSLAMVASGGAVELRDLDSLRVVRTFAVEGAEDIVFSADGTLWLLSRDKVLQYRTDGRPTGRSIDDVEKPTAISVAPDGRLVVCDDGERQQVHFYDIRRAPRRLESFGRRGGLRSGVRGKAAPDKLFGLRGAGLDARGNLYVACGFGKRPEGGLVLRSFDATRRLLWELSCFTFAQVYDARLRGGELEVYGPREVFRLRHDGPPGDWEVDRYTLDWPHTPADPRVTEPLLQATVAARDVDGRRLIYTWGSGGNSPVEIFALGREGEFSRHVGTVGPKGVWAWEVDSKGDIWREGVGRTIWRHAFKGFDDRGAPKYAPETPESWPYPDGVSEVCRLVYAPESDALYVGGYTKSHPKPQGQWGLAGGALMRFDGWEGGARRMRWETGLPRDDDGLHPKAMHQTGDYLFVAACKSTKGLRAQVFVYRTSDGAYVGVLSAPPEIARNCGWVDMSHGLRARHLADGRYVVFLEEDWHGKVLVYIWRP